MVRCGSMRKGRSENARHIWCNAAVRPLQGVHARRSALRLRRPVYFRSRCPRALPVPVHVVSRRARVFDHAAFRLSSRFPRFNGCCLPAKQTGSARDSSVFGAQSPGPPIPLSPLRRAPHDAPCKTRGRNRVPAPFPWSSFIPDNMPVYPGALATLNNPDCLGYRALPCII